MSAIDDYLQQVTPAQKAGLERVRKIVRKAVPEAEEVISYGIPAFRYHKQYLIGLAAFKNHLSVFPTSHPIEVLAEQLGGFELSKGSIHFTTDHPIPESIISELLRTRLKDIEAAS